MSRVSIVIATVGRPSLEAAVNSVYNQSSPTKLLVMWDSNQSGASATRNKAIRHLNTDWVGFLDDDDTIDVSYSEWLEGLYRYDVVVFGMLQSGIRIPREPKLKYGDVGISFALKADIFKENPFPTATDEYIEDFLMLKQLQDRGYSIYFSDKVAYYVRP